VKLEHEAFITGEQIRSLSRFIAAQKTAFRKLLKKYKKWSGSPVLEDRFRAEVLNRPSSFTNTSLAETFDRWTDLLQAARAARQPSQSLNSSPDIRPESHVLRARAPSRKLQESSAVIAQQLSQAVGSLNDVAFDTAFSEVPMGESGTRAVYWVHSEQLIELQVLLLQHLRLYITKPTLETPSLLSQSPVVTRRSSLSVKQDGTAERESDSGVIYLDDPESYGQRQSRATVSDSESLSSSSPLRAAVAARWASSTEDAAVSIRLQKRAGKKGTAMLRQKHLGALLNADRDFKPWKPSGQATPGLDPSEFAAQSTLSADEAREILEQRRELQLLVALLSKRTRFVGLFNSASVGQWATLDSQISYTKVDKDDLTGKDWISKLNRKAQDFPFAILRVRQEGKFAKDLIEVLDQSHLTERVRGFSLISHAIWSCWKPRGMTAPFWLPALEKDIRKVPENVVLGRRRSSQITSAEHGQNSSASSNSEFDRSGSSTAVAADSSATSVPNTPMLERDFGSGLHSIPEQKPKKVTLDEVSFDKTSRRKRREETRYWNEYDNPDSENDANAYYIYIDPNQEDKWPGQDMFQIFARKLRSIFSKGGHVDEVNDEERAFIRPLTEVEDEDEGASSPTDSEPDSPAKISSSIFAVKQKRASKHGGYGTMSSRMGNARLTDLLLPPAATDVSPSKSSRLLISTLSLVAASVLSVLIFTLAATGRKKQKGEVDAGILLGVIASLFFAMVGLVSVLSSRENIGLANWVVIGAVFCTICLADGVLVGYVLV
jgi:SPX domain protein involved in polyphosphate accumulation